MVWFTQVRVSFSRADFATEFLGTPTDAVTESIVYASTVSASRINSMTFPTSMKFRAVKFSLCVCVLLVEFLSEHPQVHLSAASS